MNDRTISSLLIALAYALALALTLIACGTSGGLSSVPPGSGDASSRLPASSGQPSGGGTSQSKAQGSTMTQGSAMAQAYQDALEDIYNKRVYPNGDLVDLLPDARMEENHFTLFDVDGDGMIYLLTFGGQEVAATQLDGPDFEKWLDTYVAGAAELDIPWQDMTPENIQAITGLSFPY